MFFYDLIGRQRRTKQSLMFIWNSHKKKELKIMSLYYFSFMLLISNVPTKYYTKSERLTD